MPLPPALSDEHLARLPGAAVTPTASADAPTPRRRGERSRAAVSRLIGRAVRPQLTPVVDGLAALQQTVAASADLDARLRRLEVTNAVAQGGSHEEDLSALRAQLALLLERVGALEAAIEAESPPPPAD